MEPSEYVAKTLGDRTRADMKALAPEAAHSESTSTAFSHSAEKRHKQVNPACSAAARFLDAELDSQPGSPEPVESELNIYNSGNALDLVAGAYAELSSAFNAIADLIASQLADEHGTCNSIFLQMD